MRTRYFALALGIVFVIVGILGFVPGVSLGPHDHWPELTVDSSYKSLFGIFAVNSLHNLVHLAIGLWGIWAYGNFARSRSYSRSVAIIYGVLAIIGLFPILNTMFGVVPLFGHDIWLHAGTAAVAAYFGFVDARDVEGERDRVNVGTRTTFRPQT